MTRRRGRRAGAHAGGTRGGGGGEWGGSSAGAGQGQRRPRQHPGFARGAESGIRCGWTRISAPPSPSSPLRSCSAFLALSACLRALLSLPLPRFACACLGFCLAAGLPRPAPPLCHCVLPWPPRCCFEHALFLPPSSKSMALLAIGVDMAMA